MFGRKIRRKLALRGSTQSWVREERQGFAPSCRMAVAHVTLHAAKRGMCEV